MARHHKMIIELIEQLFNFKDGWIEWFCYENDFGRKKLKCSVEGAPEIQITNSAELWEFIQNDVMAF